MKKFLTLFFITIILNSCSDKEVLPGDVLDKKKMAEVLTDIHLAQSANAGKVGVDTSLSVTANYSEFIYKKHQIKKEEFLHSLKYYSENPEMLQLVYDSVIANLSKLQGEVESEQ